MLSESMGLLGVVTLSGGVAITAVILLFVVLAVCARLHLLLRKAEIVRKELIAANK